MPSFFRSAAVLAIAGAAVANPLNRRDDACLAAVTGKAALGDDSLRKQHCSSFFSTIVTPPATTVTVTVTGLPKRSLKKKAVTVCPNEVPNYASACNTDGYSSACSVFGVTAAQTTVTIPAVTTTATVYVDPTCTAGANVTITAAGPTTTLVIGVNGTTTITPSTIKVTVTDPSVSTVTVTAAAGTGNSTISTVTQTVTVPSGPTGTGSVTYPNATDPNTCLTSASAKVFTDAFKNFLEFTNQGTPNVSSPYNQALSDKILATGFQDYSDSINWMSGRPLGSITFKSKAEFDSEQGSGQQPISIVAEQTWLGCKTITWKWTALTSTYATVSGINLFTVTDDMSQLASNYAEFNSAAWVQSLSALAAYYPGAGFDKIDCKVPDLTGGSGALPNNGTATATTQSTSTVVITATASATTT